LSTAPVLSTDASPPPVPPPHSGLRRIGAALHYRDFRILWFGAFTSTIGTWMQRVAQNWLVLTITGSSSAFFLGLDSFLGELPILLFTLVGGVIADRHDRRRLLLMSQYIQMTTAFTLAALVYFDRIHIWHVLTLSTITGLAQAFGGPAHQSLLPSLVKQEDVPNAVAFNSIQFNLARVIGPLLAGGALAAFGMAACFGLNGISFLAVIAAIFALRIRHVPSTAPSRLREEFHGGLTFVRERPALIGLAVLGFATTFLGNPFLTFLPLFAQNVFHGTVSLYTQLLACASAGAVTGALFVAWRGRFPHMGRAALLMQLAYALLILLFALTRVLWLNAIILFLAGICMVTVTSMFMSLVQLTAPNEMRGRVMSIYMVAFRGGMPLGSLVSGWIASRASAPAVLMINGILLSLVAAWFLLRGDGVREL
jgi:MFS family permease